MISSQQMHKYIYIYLTTCPLDSQVFIGLNYFDDITVGIIPWSFFSLHNNLI